MMVQGNPDVVVIGGANGAGIDSLWAGWWP